MINQTLYSWYDPQRLNESYYVINSTLNAGSSTGPGYIFATLKAYNATGTDTNYTGPGTSDGTPEGGGGKSKGTSLAM